MRRNLQPGRGVTVPRWSEIERHIERARALRAEVRRRFVADAVRGAWRRIDDKLRRLVRRPAHAALLFALGVAAAALPQSGNAQEIAKMTADSETNGQARDLALLAALGLELAAIEQATDAELLWRAVRELVLPARVSEATQRRILRRVWLADPAICDGSAADSATN